MRLVRKTHGGIVSALNTGLEHARGQLIARMDADDIAQAERLEKQVRFLEGHPGIRVFSCGVTFGGDVLASAGHAAHVDWINRLIEPEEISWHRFVEAPVAPSIGDFRAELIGRHGGYREGDFPEDYELWLR